MQTSDLTNDQINLVRGHDRKRGVKKDPPCPECRVPLESKWFGVECPSCGYWFSY